MLYLYYIPYLVPAEVAGAPAAEERGAGLALVQVAAGARGRQARRGKSLDIGGENKLNTLTWL